MKDFKAGSNKIQVNYKAFIPQKINRLWQFTDTELLKLSSKADREMKRLNMFTQYLDLELFSQILITNEVAQLDRWGGFHSVLNDISLLPDHFKNGKFYDWLEIQNCMQSTYFDALKISKMPFSSRLIKHTHKLLLKGVKDHKAQVGKYRDCQYWIGGTDINNALFVPPPHSEIPELMEDLINFGNNFENPLPHLIKLGIIYYQFETIHPFLDRNKLVDSFLTTFYLMDKDLLNVPIFFISGFFEKHLHEYHTRLMRVRTHNDIGQWLKFFLSGIIESASETIKSLEDIFHLHEDLNEIVSSLHFRKKNSHNFLEYLLSHPIVIPNEVVKKINLSNVSVYNLIYVFENLGFIREITGRAKDRIYIFEKYLNLMNV